MILTREASLGGHESRVWHVCWSPDGKFLASCSEDRTVIVWGKKNKENESEWSHCHQFLRHTGSVRRIEWSPKGDVIASASFDQHILIHRVDFSDDNLDLTTKVITKIGGHSAEIKSVAFSSKDELLLASTARDRLVNVWDVSDFDEPTCVGNLVGHTQDIKCCVWHPTYRHLLVTGSYDNSIRFWLDPAVDTKGLLMPDVDDDSDSESSWKPVEIHEKHTSTVWDVTFENERTSSSSLTSYSSSSISSSSSSSPSSSASSSSSSSSSSSPPSSSSSSSPTLSPTSSISLTCTYGNSTVPRFASASADGSVIVWIRESVDRPYRLFQRISVPFDGAVVYSVDWAKSGGDGGGGSDGGSSSAIFASGDGNNNVLIFSENATSHEFMEVARAEEAHYADVNCVRFCPTDPFLLASAGDDGMVHLWRLSISKGSK